MIIHVFKVFWPEKSIPMVNFTLKCFLDKFSATPICDRGKIFDKNLKFHYFTFDSHDNACFYHFWVQEVDSSPQF